MAATLSSDIRIGERVDAWDFVIDYTLNALGEAPTREAASLRLNWLLNANLLSEADRCRFAELLWAPEFLNEGLPGSTVFFPSAFLSLPAPDGLDKAALVAGALLIGTPLTDAVVAEGGLANAYSDRSFALDGDKLCGEIGRLHDFVAGHSPAPQYPDLFGDDRTALVKNSALMAAGLALRALNNPDATDSIRALVTLNQYPLRTEPAIPALLLLGILDATTAIDRLRLLLGGTDEIEPFLLGAFLDQLLAAKGFPEAVEAEIWKELARAVAERRPGPLAHILRFAAHVCRTAPGRIPKTVDDVLSLGLSLILAETEVGAQGEQASYDPFLARYFGALLVTAMDDHDRGESALRSAWAKAIEADALPDTRRARALARSAQ